METLYKILVGMGVTDWAVLVLVIGLFVDISKIKFNPIQFIVGHLGNAFNKSTFEKLDKIETEMNERIDKLEEQFKEMKKEQNDLRVTQKEIERSADLAELQTLKNRILDFSNKLSMKQKFTLEQYRTIMDDYARYHHIIDKYDDLINGKIDVEYNTILTHFNTYKECGEFMF